MMADYCWNILRDFSTVKHRRKSYNVDFEWICIKCQWFSYVPRKKANSMAKLAGGFILFVYANLGSCLFDPTICGLHKFVVVVLCYLNNIVFFAAAARYF